jgi:hypothetical protein
MSTDEQFQEEEPVPQLLLIWIQMRMDPHHFAGHISESAILFDKSGVRISCSCKGNDPNEEKNPYGKMLTLADIDGS